MNTTTKTLTAMCLATTLFVTTGCDLTEELGARGELTNGLCFQGFENRTSLYMASHSDLQVRVGRLRHVPFAESDFGIVPDRQEEWYCDVSQPVDVRTAWVLEGFDTRLEVGAVDGALHVVSRGPGAATIALRTPQGPLELDLEVYDVAKTSLRIDGERPSFEDETILVAGTRPIVEVTYHSDATPYGGASLLGTFDWSSHGLWTTESIEVRDVHDYARGAAGTWERLHTVRVTDTPGEYMFSVPGVFSRPDDTVRVVSPDEVTLMLCLGPECVQPGNRLSQRFFSDVGSNVTASFCVVLFDGEGNEVVGLPDDFEVRTPEGWEDGRARWVAAGQTYWTLDALTDSPGPGAIEVTAFGRDMEFSFEAPR